MQSAFQVVSNAITRMTRAPYDGVRITATDDLNTVFIQYGPGRGAVLNIGNDTYRISIRKKNGRYGLYRICRDEKDATQRVIDFLTA